MPWSAERTHTFPISYKKLSPEFQRKVDEVIIQLMSSEDPRKLEYRKIGKWKDAYSYEIGRKEGRSESYIEFVLRIRP